MSQLPPIPDDLVLLLGELQGIRNDPARLVTSEFSRKLYEMCHRQLRGDDPIRQDLDSYDLSQEVFLDLAEGAALFRGRTWNEFFGFVREVIERRKIRQARGRNALKRGGDRRQESLKAARSEEDPRGTTSQIIREDEELKLLQAHIKGLPDAERIPLERYLHKVPYDEIAEELGLSQDAARKRVSRAIQRLREELS